MSIEWKGREVEKWARDRILKELRSAAALAEAEAKLVCPVRTGRLKNSIMAVVDEANLRAVVGSDVEYAFWVEAGTSMMAGRGYLRHALEVLRSKGWKVEFKVRYL